MIEILPDGTKEVHCDRCGKLLTEVVEVCVSGDMICPDCFKNEWKEVNVEEYLKDDNS